MLEVGWDDGRHSAPLGNAFPNRLLDESDAMPRVREAFPRSHNRLRPLLPVRQLPG